jgi:4'-phosphopantetheinyl transferase
MLSAAESARADGLLRGTTRDSFAVGAGLLRLAVQHCVGIAAPDVVVERSCRWCAGAHGRPVLRGAADGWHASVTHSEGLVAVAVTAAGPVGIDAERVTESGDLDGLIAAVLAPDEPRPDSMREFLRYWTRKESVLKATGDGLTRPMPDVVVSGAGQAAALISLFGQAVPAAMCEPGLRPDYVTAVTVLSAAPVAFEVHPMTRERAA